MITWQEIVLRLSLSAILGGLVGIERERLDWAAGLRTHMLVCLGSALMMIVSSFGFSDILGTPDVNLDPSRIAAQVVSGIGFLGAGTIFFLKPDIIKGLTTAAGLWTVAGIGLAIGGGLYFAGSIATALVLIILVLVKPYKKKIEKMHSRREIRLLVSRQQTALQQIETIAKSNKLNFSNITLQPSDKADIDVVYIRFAKAENNDALLNAVELIRNLPGIVEAVIKTN